MSTKISVIICTYNRAKYITRAIDSVLAQNYADFEIIVIDDASTDSTEQVLVQYTTESRIKVVRNEKNLGISKSRNKGVALASGAYIAMLDSDDYWTDPEKLTKQASLLNEHPDIGIVGTMITLVRPDDSIIEKKYTYHFTDTDIRNTILTRNQFMQSSVLFRKNIFETVGGYNETYAVAEDFDLFLRIGKVSHFANIEESTVNYLVHPGNTSKAKRKMALTVNRIIKNYKKDYPYYRHAKCVSFLRILKAFF